MTDERQNQYGPSSVIADAAVMLRAYADRYEERADEEREALERLLGAHRPDRDGNPPVFDGRVLSHRQACAIAEAVISSDVWRNRCKHAWRRVSPGFDTTREAYEHMPPQGFVEKLPDSRLVDMLRTWDDGERDYYGFRVRELVRLLREHAGLNIKDGA